MNLKFLGRRKVLIDQCEDSYGRIAVDAIAGYRFLVFGENVEQSCVKVDNPAWLEYQYTRAMLLGGLCHPSPESALFLGLGSGVLTQACMLALPSLYDIEVIELRPDVVRMASQHLGFNAKDERLTLRYGDAMELLQTAEQADLIFMDLYDENGPARGHLAWKFLQDCRDKLNENGWLIINQWATADYQPLAAALLRGVFEHHYWEIPVKEGNVILLVPASYEQTLPLAELRQRAKQLTKILGYRLTNVVERIRVPVL